MSGRTSGAGAPRGACLDETTDGGGGGNPDDPGSPHRGKGGEVKLGSCSRVLQDKQQELSASQVAFARLRSRRDFNLA